MVKPLILSYKSPYESVMAALHTFLSVSVPSGQSTDLAVELRLFSGKMMRYGSDVGLSEARKEAIWKLAREKVDLLSENHLEKGTSFTGMDRLGFQVFLLAPNLHPFLTLWLELGHSLDGFHSLE